LSITKDDGVTSYVPGANLTYTIVVNNAGPSDVSGATVSDARPAQIGSWTWTCTSSGGATCAGSAGSITTDFNDTVNMPSGSSITYTVVAQVLSSATGDLTNTATVAAPTGVMDPTPANNTDDDTDTQNPLVDLSVTKSDGQDFYLAGGTLTYTIVVSNGGPSDVVGATVTDTLPTQIDSWSWVCTSQAGGANGCDPYTGSADFSDTVNLPVGGSITYTVTANLAASATGLLTNTVTIAPPTGYTDPTPDNNSADDVDQPASLTITKDDGLTIVAPGSLITYTIQLTNPGAVDLTSITVTDILPPELSYQSATPVPTTAPAPGSAGGTITWTGVSLALGANTTFTVTAQVDPSLPTGGSLTNTVSVEDTNTGLSDSADDTDLILIDVNNGKSILDTNEPTTTLPNVAIGEIVTYQISIDVPASSTLTNLRALDVLDSGLAFVRCVRIDPGSLTTTLPGGFGDACNDPTNPTVAVEPIGDPGQINQGRRIQFDLGSVSNSSSSDIRLLVEYEVVVLNIPANVNGVGGLNNTVLWTWYGGSLSAVAPPLEIVEPQMSIVKDATPTVAPYGATITFSLDIAHTLESTADAFDVVVTDVLPPGLAFIPGTVSTTGLAPDLIDYVGTSLTFVWNVFPLNATALLTFQATFVGPAPVVNTADLAWTSLPIDPGLGGAPIEQSPYNDYSTERYYDPPAANGVNNYGTSSSVSITVPSLPATGFAPGRLTALPAQPADKAYTALLGGAWLEIPDLGLSLPILSVPVSSTGWDLTWLSNQAGYLAGTTLPGNVGTTGLTAHVTLADGTPGPFRNLSRLYWGNKVILHADGYRYLYEVRESRTVLPRDLSVLKQDGYTWLTLLTCEGYVPWLDTYNYRLAVRAVLLSVEPDSAATPFPAQPARLPEQRETSR
jgi:LPXTG-site transpeptidase (sortase) family protein